MINGIYLSTMGALVQTAQHGIVANNLANTSTTGFKPDHGNFKELLSESLLQPGHRMEIDKILEKTGGGVWLNETVTLFDQGALTETGNPLHMAITTENGFLQVRKDGEDFLTRSGEFAVNTEGMLTLSDGSSLVLSTDGEPINVSELVGEKGLEILPEGGLQSVDTGDVVATLGLVSVSDPARLVKAGDQLFRNEGAAVEAGQVSVRSGYVEASAVDPVKEMVAMIEATRAYQANMKMITIQDESLGRTVNTVGSVRG